LLDVPNLMQEKAGVGCGINCEPNRASERDARDRRHPQTPPSYAGEDAAAPESRHT
jgi:hypothetical protein